MRLILASLLALALLSCTGDEDEPSAGQPSSVDSTPTAVSTPVPTLATAGTTATPGGCEPLVADGGFPVMLGSFAGQACVIWRGAGAARVIVEAGSFATDVPPTSVVTFDAVTSPFVFPSGVLPGIRPGQPCFERDGGYRVRVEAVTGESIGGEERYTCSYAVILADGCSVSAARSGPFGLGRIPGVPPGQPSACIAWPDRRGDETGFRIELTYPNSGEKFTYLVPPGTVEFVPPEADTRGVGSFPAGLGRKDWSVTVVALTPDGEIVVGAQSVQVQ